MCIHLMCKNCNNNFKYDRLTRNSKNCNILKPIEVFGGEGINF